MSIDETLRALEKEMREAFDAMYQDTMYVHCARANEWADRIAALLTTRQEVAPVAWGVRSVHAECGDLWMCDFGLATIWKENADRYADWLNENNAVDGPFVVVGFHDYTSTGQTSGARDGE